MAMAVLSEARGPAALDPGSYKAELLGGGTVLEGE
jgi:hypothetical protein